MNRIQELVSPRSLRARCNADWQASPDRLQQNHEYLVRDLPQSEHQVYLKVNRRQLKCELLRKKPFSEGCAQKQLPLKKSDRQIYQTKRFSLIVNKGIFI